MTTTLAPQAQIDMSDSAKSAAAFLKTLAHEGRLMILCHLVAGEKSVGELEQLLDMRQAAVSQMLAAYAKISWCKHGAMAKRSIIACLTQIPNG